MSKTSKQDKTKQKKFQSGEKIMKKGVSGKKRKKKKSCKTADSFFLAFDTRNYSHTAHYVSSTGQNAHLTHIYILKKNGSYFPNNPQVN